MKSTSPTGQFSGLQTTPLAFLSLWLAHDRSEPPKILSLHNHMSKFLLVIIILDVDIDRDRDRDKTEIYISIGREMSISIYLLLVLFLSRTLIPFYNKN